MQWRITIVIISSMMMMHNARQLGQHLDGQLVIIVLLALGMKEETDGGKKVSYAKVVNV